MWTARVGGGGDAWTCVAIELQLSRDPDRWLRMALGPIRPFLTYRSRML
jgi:hypothetical protein